MQEMAVGKTHSERLGFRNEDGLPSMICGVPEYDDWIRTGLSFRGEFEKTEESVAWPAAKWLVHGYKTFIGPNTPNIVQGGMLRDAERLSGLTRNTLIAYFKVGRTFPDGPLVPELSFAHHRAVVLIPDPEQRAHWLHQAAKKKMSVSKLKKAVKKLIPVKPKLGIKPTLEAKHYARRLQNLNPKDHIWGYIMSDIQGGYSLDDYSELHEEMKKSADILFLNLKQLDSALAGRPPVPKAVQERIKPPQLVEAEKLEAIGSKVSEAA
jgi:hypothetical protein